MSIDYSTQEESIDELSSANPPFVPCDSKSWISQDSDPSDIESFIMDASDHTWEPPITKDMIEAYIPHDMIQTRQSKSISEPTAFSLINSNSIHKDSPILIQKIPRLIYHKAWILITPLQHHQFKAHHQAISVASELHPSNYVPKYCKVHAPKCVWSKVNTIKVILQFHERSEVLSQFQ